MVNDRGGVATTLASKRTESSNGGGFRRLTSLTIEARTNGDWQTPRKSCAQTPQTRWVMDAIMLLLPNIVDRFYYRASRNKLQYILHDLEGAI